MEPPPHGGGEAAGIKPAPKAKATPQWSRPLTGAESEAVGEGHLG